MRFWITLASINAFIAVAASAAAAHMVSTDDTMVLRAILSAIALHGYHALALFIVAWMSERAPSRLVSIAGGAFIFGVIFFSGSLYVYGLTGSALFAHIAPFGGAAFLAGWAALALAGICGTPSSKMHSHQPQR